MIILNLNCGETEALWFFDSLDLDWGWNLVNVSIDWYVLFYYQTIIK